MVRVDSFDFGSLHFLISWNALSCLPHIQHLILLTSWSVSLTLLKLSLLHSLDPGHPRQLRPTTMVSLPGIKC